MSKMSKIVETALEKRHREYVDNTEKAVEHMQERSLEEDEYYKIPKMIYCTKVESKNMFGCQMVTFNCMEDTERLIIYLHGGIYVNEIRLPHIIFCDKLAKKVNACVFAPIYPLAPNHSYEETYEIDKLMTMKDDESENVRHAFIWACENIASNSPEMFCEKLEIFFRNAFRFKRKGKNRST